MAAGDRLTFVISVIAVLAFRCFGSVLVDLLFALWFCYGHVRLAFVFISSTLTVDPAVEIRFSQTGDSMWGSLLLIGSSWQPMIGSPLSFWTWWKHSLVSIGHWHVVWYALWTLFSSCSPLLANACTGFSRAQDRSNVNDIFEPF